jgi:hypothetical protein
MATVRAEPRSIAGRSVQLKELPARLSENSSVKLAQTVLGAVDSFANDHASISADHLLSDRGKKAKLDPLVRDTMRTIASAAAVNLGAADTLNKREAAMLAVPPLSPGDAAGAAVDVEIRQWWRSLGTKQRVDMLEQFNKGPEHQRIEAALLRSPVALADPELLSIRQSWNRQARLDNASEASAIDSERYALDWSNDAISNAAAIAMVTSAVPKSELLRMVVTGDNLMAKGAYVFGFSPDQIDRAKVLADNEAA